MIRRSPQPEADALEAAREDRAGEQRADQAERRRVRRGGAAREQQRTEARAEEGAQREPAERQHADDEAPAGSRNSARTTANATMIQSSCVTCHVLQLLDRKSPPAAPAARPSRDRPGRAWRSRSARSSGAQPRRLALAHARPAVRRAPGRAATTRTMYADIDAASQRRTSTGEFADAYRQALTHGDRHGRARRRARAHAPPAARWSPCASHTRLFGTLSLHFVLRSSTSAGEGPRVRLVALARLPRPARRRAAQPPHRAAAARDAAGPRRHGARRRAPEGQSRQPASDAARRSGNWRARWSARVGPMPASRAGGTGSRRGAARTRSSASAASSARSTAACGGRPAASCSPARRAARVPSSPRAAPAVRSTRLPRRSSARRHRARRPARRGRRDAALHRPDPGGRRDRPGQACSRRARRSRWSPSPACSAAHIAEPAHRLPLCHLRHARRRQAEQRQRRGMRRHARTGLRGVLQLRVRAARRQARRAAPGGDGRTLRLQPRSRASRAPPRARCRRPRRSRANSTSARRRSARARCWRRRCEMATVAATIADGGLRPRADLRARRRRRRGRARRSARRSRAPCAT